MFGSVICIWPCVLCPALCFVSGPVSVSGPLLCIKPCDMSQALSFVPGPEFCIWPSDLSEPLQSGSMIWPLVLGFVSGTVKCVRYCFVSDTVFYVWCSCVSSPVLCLTLCFVRTCSLCLAL